MSNEQGKVGVLEGTQRLNINELVRVLTHRPRSAFMEPKRLLSSLTVME